MVIVIMAVVMAVCVGMIVGVFGLQATHAGAEGVAQRAVGDV